MLFPTLLILRRMVGGEYAWIVKPSKKITIKNMCPTPRLDDLLDTMVESSIFSKIDFILVVEDRL